MANYNLDHKEHDKKIECTKIFNSSSLVYHECPCLAFCRPDHPGGAQCSAGFSHGGQSHSPWWISHASSIWTLWTKVQSSGHRACLTCEILNYRFFVWVFWPHSLCFFNSVLLLVFSQMLEDDRSSILSTQHVNMQQVDLQPEEPVNISQLIPEFDLIGEKSKEKKDDEDEEEVMRL